MSVDLSQFHQVFFEESHEGLDTMESALLAIDVNDIDSESITVYMDKITIIYDNDNSDIRYFHNSLSLSLFLFF